MTLLLGRSSIADGKALTEDTILENVNRSAMSVKFTNLALLHSKRVVGYSQICKLLGDMKIFFFDELVPAMVKTSLKDYSILKFIRSFVSCFTETWKHPSEKVRQVMMETLSIYISTASNLLEKKIQSLDIDNHVLDHLKNLDEQVAMLFELEWIQTELLNNRASANDFYVKLFELDGQARSILYLKHAEADWVSLRNDKKYLDDEDLKLRFDITYNLPIKSPTV